MQKPATRSTSTAIVTGAGGFIGHHLVKRLKARGAYVVGLDIKAPAFEPSAADEFYLLDLRQPDSFPPLWLYAGELEVYALAADMGGMGYIATHDADILQNNLRINLNTASAVKGVGAKVFFASSACVYNETLQLDTDNPALAEHMAYPAQPDLAYGWEKLLAERIYTAHAQQGDFEIRIARFHNIYGELGTWQGGREKAPAALCRKVAHAKLTGVRAIDVWGDGEQTRSFCYIDDCLDGIERLMASPYDKPLNIGSAELVSINTLAALAMDVADYPCAIAHDLSKPQGVRGRNSDNTLVQQVLDWQPGTSLRDGLAKTYRWIEAQVAESLIRRELA